MIMFIPSQMFLSVTLRQCQSICKVCVSVSSVPGDLNCVGLFVIGVCLTGKYVVISNEFVLAIWFLLLIHVCACRVCVYRLACRCKVCVCVCVCNKSVCRCTVCV